MKKNFILLVVTLIMTICTTCLAANDGEILNNEQKICKQVFDIIQGGGNYGELQPKLEAELAKNWPEKKFQGIGNDIKERFGGIENQKFVMLQKFDKVDRVTYLAGTGKKTIVEIGFVFETNETLLLKEFWFREVQQQQPAQPEKKENTGDGE